MNENILRLNEITKTFPGVIALDRVHLEIRRGEVHALCGENGAGKSTLMKIISGAQQFTSGEMLFDDESVNFKNTKEARDLGISMIYQEFNLIPHLSIAENLFVGNVPVYKSGRINWRELEKDAVQLLEKVGLDLPVRTPVAELSTGEAQMVEIAKCLSADARLIIMDEPTASLTDKEIHYLFDIVKKLKEHGISIIYISHRLDEIFRISDRITVFRDGRYIATEKTSETSHDELVRMMVGRNIEELYPERPEDQPDAGDLLFRVEGLGDGESLKDITFGVRPGEILGLAGLLGSGNIRTGKLLAGYYGKYDGTVSLDGRELHIKNPKDAIDNGISCVSDDRKKEGLVLIRSVRENISLATLHRLIKKWPLRKIDSRREDQIVKKQISNLNIKVFSPAQITGNLSGGNQQKVVFGKMLETKPKLLILIEPTRGIDIGAKAEIYKIMRELAGAGIGVILVSSDLPELIGMSDRALVMRGGKIVKELQRNELSQERVLYFAAGGCDDE